MNDKDNQTQQTLILSSINFYLDYLYSLQKNFLTESGELKEDFSNDLRAVSLIQDNLKNANKYEELRKKVQNNVTNFSTEEKNRIILTLFFLEKQLKKDIVVRNEMLESLSDLKEKMLKNSTLKNLDFLSKT